MTTKFQLYFSSKNSVKKNTESQKLVDSSEDNKNISKERDESNVNKEVDQENDEKNKNILDFLKNKKIDDSKVDIQELQENIFKYEKENSSKNIKSKRKK